MEEVIGQQKNARHK